MLRVGLTGGVASGKSTVAAMLGARGAVVRDADAVVEDLYLPGAAGATAVAVLFGPRLLAPDGSVDRAALAALVLADAPARALLEVVIHPLVRAEIEAWIGRLAAASPTAPVAIVEAALLVETGAYAAYDRLVAVSSPLELRRARALAAGWPAERFERVVAAQLDDRARAAVASYEIDNAGGLDELRAAVAGLWHLLLQDAAAKALGKPLPPRP